MNYFVEFKVAEREKSKEYYSMSQFYQNAKCRYSLGCNNGDVNINLIFSKTIRNIKSVRLEIYE